MTNFDIFTVCVGACGILGSLSGFAAFSCYLYYLFRKLDFSVSCPKDRSSYTVTVTNTRSVGISVQEVFISCGHGARLIRPFLLGNAAQHLPQTIPPWTCFSFEIGTANLPPVLVDCRIVLRTTSGRLIKSCKRVFPHE